MKFRPEAAIFDILPEDELRTLAADIDANGQKLPIYLYEGDILDGRNRWLAMTKYGRNGHQPRFENVNPESPTSFVISLNLTRRHLNDSQRAMAGTRALPFYEAEAKKRQGDGGKKAAPGRPADGKTGPDGPELSPQPHRARADVAVKFNVPERSIGRAKRIATQGSPELVRTVETGQLSLGTAEKIIKQTSDYALQTDLAAEAAQSRMANRVKGLTGEIEWYTPREYLDLAVEVMDIIELDPASSEAAQAHVQAARHFTVAENGLAQQWFGRIWLNPPYAMPAIRQFVDKLIAEYRAGRTTEAVLLTNNATDTEWWHQAFAACSAMCFTRGRISFLQVRDGQMLAKTSPTNGQVFTYFGSRPERFRDVFSRIGAVVLTDC